MNAKRMEILTLIHTNERHATIGRWTLDHMWFPANSDDGRAKLVVCFGGRKYGYIRSLYLESRDHPNLLYLQDNLGENGVNLWWMAWHGDFSVSDAYHTLIERYIDESGVDIANVSYIGNCIGGFGALYYSFMLGGGTAVAVCPIIALGTVYGGLPMAEWIVGDSGLDLDEHIFNHFDRHTDVKLHLFSAHTDNIVVTGRLARFVELMITRCNLFSLRNVEIVHGAEIKTHSAIAYAINGNTMLLEAERPLEYECILGS